MKVRFLSDSKMVIEEIKKKKKNEHFRTMFSLIGKKKRLQRSSMILLWLGLRLLAKC